ncbi:MAG: FIST C-terminal domain-containing protein [Rhizobiales bacterium]|nr:FIST C-terminal domain-containing protein [Hyphomicrobiales bacterium]
MRVEQFFWSNAAGWSATGGKKADLVLYFGTRQSLADGARYEELRALFSNAHIVGCTTGGQIRNNDVSDDEISAVAMTFEATTTRIACETIADAAQSRTCGEAIGHQLLGGDLAGVFVLSDGLNVNGSELVAGITNIIGRSIPLTGGLAGDGPAFEQTMVGADCVPRSNTIAAIGFYGSAIRFGHGSAGGWDVFGPRRRITRSAGNVLFDLDGEPALDLYERYLGDEAKGLPGTALLFPLQINDPAHPKTKLVRTVLAVDRDKRSMTFAGDMPEGWSAQLMRGNFHRLAAGAADAARQAYDRIGDAANQEGVAVLVSCIGRRLLMGQRITDEIDAAGAALGSHMARLGFYSYGEIAPHSISGYCDLHNQTMTVTTITEVAA